ncbi:DUF2345 domain-containing protein, partial [Stenotrophomonas sp. MMGLT7]|uniref:DUF2345 domain-containing protein n=1 Tax=Stenotrophomonas sp. MMGLT7 TaxID=2901227 RepID=UPI001E52AC10
APNKHLLATAAGAYIRIEGGNIELGAPGTVEFKASKKELAGAAHASLAGIVLPESEPLNNEMFEILDENSGEPMPWEPYHIIDQKGRVLAEGLTNSSGETQRVHTAGKTKVKLVRGWSNEGNQI